MDAVHLHLILNHFPVVCVFIGLLFFVVSLFSKCENFRNMGLMLWVLAGLFVGPTYLSGEEAEEKLESQAWFQEDWAHHHEEKAEVALAATIALAIISLATLILIKKKNFYPPALRGLLLLLALLSAYLIADTANHGGEIRHTEIRASDHQHSAGDAQE